MQIIEYCGIGLVCFGALIFIISAVGLMRFSDFFARSHAAGLNDVFGSMVSLCGIMLLSGFNMFTLKVALLVVIILISSPTSTYILAKIATKNGAKK